MADCMPFFGIADLREVLTAVKDRHAQSVQQCRPLKAARYLEVWSYTVNFATKLLRFKASVPNSNSLFHSLFPVASRLGATRN